MAPHASCHCPNAADRPMAAAAGMVVTEMNTPMRALARACRIDTTPTMPAMTATTTEKRLGWLIRSDTGRNPGGSPGGAWPSPG